MTTRLKRKLNDLGVDPSSSKANESFCWIGTPLPPLEKAKDTGEFVPLWKQEVRDEKGRRRLHGAFTGGFSAGYFNSVGSKEGWAPTTFVSSRSDRAKTTKAASRPEDFMDEEDLAEMRESRLLVDENDEMDFGGTEAELLRRRGDEGDVEDDSMANALAASLLSSTEDSVGARILKKMGWRIGQGIGPRLTYEQKRAQDGDADGEDEDEEAKKHMYPRRDTPLLAVPRKDNSHGLGYSPGMGLHESLGVRGDGKQKGPRLAAGFGLGALNDADEDDLDVYDGTLQAQGGRRVAYDDDAEDDRIAMGSSRSTRSKAVESSWAPGVTQTFKNGGPVLKGFVLSDRPVAEDRWFPIPDVPKGWKPNPKRVWELHTNKENVHSRKGKEPPKTRAEWKSSLLTVDERGSMLGETPLPAQARSVFDFMSQKDRERLEKIKGSVNAPPPSCPKDYHHRHPPGQSLDKPDDVVAVPDLHPSVAKAALTGFQPFTADPVKQSRYTAFLQFTSASSSQDKKLSIGPMPEQSPAEFNKELADYAKAATVFKPLSGAMAGRFRSAVVVEMGPKVVEGLYTPDLSGRAQDDGERKEGEEKEENEDPRMGAVRLGMYGLLTREVGRWQPARLLCKRFGVKEPEMETESTEVAAGMEKDKHGEGDVFSENAAAAPLAITSAAAEAEAVGESKPGVRNLANVGLGEDERQGQDTLTYKRPAMDLFKAIFASDDEESEDEDVVVGAEAEGLQPVQSPTRIHTEVTAVVVPSEDAKPRADDKVDLATFKPTFIPRSDRKDKDKDREKDKKKKKKPQTIVSFDDGDEEGGGLGLQLSVKAIKRKDREKVKDGERKKKKRKEAKNEEDDDSMWVEKPAPDAVRNIDLAAVPPEPTTRDDALQGVAGPLRGRKRAVDFM
ncbi:hypothetical protein BC835DRAFT_1435011 [Cytidiella melzeri]|nr:hypothetical protein BC835DRAFT_1435011 [Cytidiella melzeri]